MRFADENSILCQACGTAVNSLVTYLFGISSADPIARGLVFECFISAECRVTPDFDVERHEEVSQYVYQPYGHEHKTMNCTYVSIRVKSALKDIRAAGWR